MTTEDDFQAALDANPEDRQTRLVFSDWLQERGDVRAGGYRALGLRGWYPSLVPHGWAVSDFRAPNGHDRSDLPADWFSATGRYYEDVHHGEDGSWYYFSTRREAEEAAALAFAKLPPERRAELLAKERSEGGS